MIVRNLSLFSLLSFLTACAPHNFVWNEPKALEQRYNKGSYRGSYYKVRQGDTLHYIAYITNKDINDIILANAISHPDKIYPGQKLNLWHKKYISPVYGAKRSIDPSAQGDASSLNRQNTSIVTIKPNPKKAANKKSEVEYSQASTNNIPLKKDNHCSNGCNREILWQWPTKGKIITHFSKAEFGNKGIDITGLRGQSIVASADGKVVYAGNALRGYGNLIIIKHDNHYLSAYAHNERLLVKESQSVTKGQTIATMGNSGTDSVRLHFEIRYKGESVNPNRYLPEV